MADRAGRPRDTDRGPRARAMAAFAHPFRLQLLSMLTGSAMSAAEVAREVGTTQANASYHLRRLQAVGLLEVTDEVVVRGGRAKRYRHDPSAWSASGGLEPADHVLVAAAIGAELQRRTTERAPGVPGSLTDAELWVDESTWVQVRDAVNQASLLLHDRAVPIRTPGAVRVSATISLFQMTQDEPAVDEGA